MIKKNSVYTRFFILIFFLCLLISCSAKTRVLIKSIPDGASVRDIEQGELGVTNTEVILDKGTKVDLLFQREGYQDKRVKQKITGKTTEIRVLLEPLQDTSFSVILEPAHAKFTLQSLDGQLVQWGKRGDDYILEDESLWKGALSAAYRIRVFAPGYESLEREIILERYKHQQLSYVLKEIYTTLSFRSEPPGVIVREKNLGYLGTTPFSKQIPISLLIQKAILLDPEKETKAQLLITFSKEGYDTLIKTEIIDLNKPNNVMNINLKKKMKEVADV